MEEKRYLKRKEKALCDGNREQLALACNHLGDFYNQLGNYRSAVQEYQQEAEIYAKLDKRLEMARAHRMVGEMFMLLSAFDSAKEHINIYLKTAKQLQNKVEEQRAYATLGRAHLLHGQSVVDSALTTVSAQLKQAERAFLKSLLLIRELSGLISKREQLDMQARCYLNIGVVKEHMGEFAESIGYIGKAIASSKSHDIFELTHLCYVSMSLLYLCKKNDATLALRYINLALEAAKRLPDKVRKICETLITKSEILIKTGDFASAKQILTKAYKKNTPDINDRATIEKSLRIVVKLYQCLDELVTTSSVDYERRKQLYEKLGDGCCHLQNYTKALEYYQLMLQCAQLNGECDKRLVPIYVSLYQSYKDNKQYDKALEYLWKEYELNKDVPVEAFATLCSIAEVCELQKQSFWTVQDIYQKAKEQAAKAGDARAKLENIVYALLWKLQLKHKMSVLAEELVKEAKEKGIDLMALEEDSDVESDGAALEQNTPEMGNDICLDDLTDSDTSDLDETDKPRTHRVTRGARSLTIKRNNKGETQLHQACIAGNLELVRRLLDQGHVTNVRDHAGWIPLHEACNHGHSDIVALLLERGAAVAINDKGGTSCDGITPLYDACSNGYLDVVELLLERGADATVKTDFGETCIDGLDKWRRANTLSEGEQAQYAQVRAKLAKPLSKVGICRAANAAPLTNAHVENDSDDTPPSDEQEHDDIRPTRKHRHYNDSRSSGNGRKTPKGSRPASFEYKHVMEQLKRPQRLLHHEEPLAAHSSSWPNSDKQRRPALLDTQEVDVDGWLVDDVGPERKKRRYLTTPTKDKPRSSSKAPASAVQTKRHSNHAVFEGRERTNANLTPEANAFDLLLTASSGAACGSQKRQAQKLRLSRSNSGSSNSSASSATCSRLRYQASLLDSGFCRFRSESPFSHDDNVHHNDKEHLREENVSRLSVRSKVVSNSTTTTPIHLIISPSKGSPIKLQASAGPPLATWISFKVKVEDELLLVPIERKKLHDINMRWLAEEASRRYYNLVGLKPVLRLKTADGFTYEENDLVNVAIEQPMVVASVLEWKRTPLVQRYEEMCHQMGKEVHTEVLASMRQGELSHSLVLEGLWLTPLLTEPVFRAVLHHINLRVLDLGNNFIQDEGCRQLAKSLPTLRQLKTLSLKGNFITSAGLEILFSAAINERLDQLEELNLSQNPLGNDSVRILDRFCSSATTQSLRHLLLSQCGLSSFYDFELCFFQLTVIDVSYNQLTEDAFGRLLSKLNSCRLQRCNLSYTLARVSPASIGHGVGEVRAERIVQFFESGTCEKFKRIELCGCFLSDAHIYRLAQCLRHAEDLELLNVSDNARLHGTSLQLSLIAMPQLQQLIAINCSHLIDDERVRQLETLQPLPKLLALTLDEDKEANARHERQLSALWLSRWGTVARIRAHDRQMVLFTNENDLTLM